jgi:hypothetical protein
MKLAMLVMLLLAMKEGWGQNDTGSGKGLSQRYC